MTNSAALGQTSWRENSQQWNRPARGLDVLGSWALCLLAFCIPWGDAIQVLDDLQFSRFLTIPAVVLWMASMAQRRSRPALSSHLFMVFFILWAGMSLFSTIDQYRSLRRLLSYSQLFLDAWLVYQLADSPRQHQLVLQAYVAGAWVGLLLLAYNFTGGVVMGDGRYTAPGFDPNDLAATLTIGIPISWHLSFGRKRGLWLNRLYLPAAVVGALLTASRTGLILLAVALLFPALGLGRVSLRALIAILLLVLITGWGVLQFQDDISIRRLTTIGSQLEARDLNGRVEAWNRGFAVFVENPLIGIGGGAFSTAISSGGGSSSAAHNTFLEILVEHGAIGFVCFAAAIITIARRTLRFAPAEKRLCLTLLLMWGIAIMVLSWENRELTWLLWGICMAPSPAPPQMRQWIAVKGHPFRVNPA